MATRQYIGARYVLKVYQNSADPSSAEWESGVVYEPLTMVTYQNSSYVSRMQVPASAGNPATATSYWAITGLYNGQIANLDNRLTAAEGDIDTLETSVDKLVNDDRNLYSQDNVFLIIGDSYTAGVEGNNYASPKQNIFAHFGKTENTNAYVRAKGGLGFMGSGDNKLNNYLISTINPSFTTDQKASIRTIIILLGSNDTAQMDDQAETRTAFISAVTDALSNLRTNYPNAVIYVFNTSSGWYYTQEQYQIQEELYSNVLPSYGIVTYMGNVGNCLKMGAGMPLILSDGIHPTQYGAPALGKQVANVLDGGSNNISWKYNTEGIIRMFIDNDLINWYAPEGVYLASATSGATWAGAAITCNGATPAVTYTLATTKINNNHTLLKSVQCMSMWRPAGTSTYWMAPTVVNIYTDGKYEFCPMILNESRNGFDSLNLDLMNMKGFETTLSLILI